MLQHARHYLISLHQRLTAAIDAQYAVCYTRVDTADVSRHLDNVRHLDTDRQTFREMGAVQLFVM